MRQLILFIATVQSFAQTGPAYEWAKQINGLTAATMTGLGADSAGNIYVAGISGAHIYLTKLDINGNLLFTKTFGGSKSEQLNAVAIDATGNTYLTGLTFSTDFPTTPNAWLRTPPANSPIDGGSFVMKVNPDGAIGYSTYFASPVINPNAIAIGSDGSAYLAGSAGPPDSLPVTPGAYLSTCACGWIPAGFIALTTYDTFLARFDPTGSRLIFATYLGLRALNNGYPINSAGGQSIAVAANGNAYVANEKVLLIDASGSQLLGQADPNLIPQSMAIAPDGSVYVAGAPNLQKFQTTKGALITSVPSVSLPAQGTTAAAAIVRLDGALSQTVSATFFATPYSATMRALATDTAGNLYVGGFTVPRGLQTALPLAQGFGQPRTGYAGELSADLSSLRFSTISGTLTISGSWESPLSPMAASSWAARRRNPTQSLRHPGASG